MYKRRINILNDLNPVSGPVIYWMSRDQRVFDNWALLQAQQTALITQSPLIVVFGLVREFLNASDSHFTFMLNGLLQVQKNLQQFSIPFIILQGNPADEIVDFIKKVRAGALVTDFDPLKIKQEWRKCIVSKINIPFYEVDAHNIVPCRFASVKQEWSARTFRLKMNKILPEFLTEFDNLIYHPYNSDFYSTLNTLEYASAAESGMMFPKITTIKDENFYNFDSGEEAASKALQHFLENKLTGYADTRNNPEIDNQSNLSPYLHFGQISAQRVALEINKSDAPQVDKDTILEQLIIRRELSDNFCYYNDNYNNYEGFQDWAKITLNKHRTDKREYLYSIDEFESAATHDEIWNAAQTEMITTGKMHGYLRMYWAKKILEWTGSPETALSTAIYLNDKYSIDGRDPNGYTGIAWSIGGVHDRPWFERDIFGSVRYMNYNGISRKFNIKKYISRVLQ